jgi:ParB/RepB/Spo0J family partition protein
MPDTIQLLKIPTQRIRPNPNQPRRIFPPGAVEAMEASLREIGQQTLAKVRPLTGVEHKDDPDHDYELIGGHIRHAGALKAGLATLDCQLLDLTPEEALLAAVVDNQNTDMHWLDWVLAIERLYNAQTEKSQRKIAVQLGFTQPRINNALKVAKALNPASRALIDNTVITLGPDNTVSEFAVRALANLLTPEEVEKALPVFLDRKMTEPQAKNYAGWVKAGNPPETYTGHKAPTPKAKKVPGIPPEVADKLIGLGKQLGTAEARDEDTQPIQEQITAYLDDLKKQAALSANASGVGPLPITPQDARELMQIVKKDGVKITKAWLKSAWHNLKGLFKNPFKPPHHAARLEGSQQMHSTRKGKLFHDIGRFFQVGAVWIVALWLCLGLLNHWVLRPMENLWSKISPGKKIENQFEGATPQSPAAIAIGNGASPGGTQPSTPNANGNINHPLAQPNPVAHLVASNPDTSSASGQSNHAPQHEASAQTQVYQPSISFQPSAEDPKVLEQEIAAFPDNTVVNDFSLAPDEGMPPDLAVSRMQNLTDPDKYIMMIGGDKQIIQSINTTTSTLTINCKSADPFGGILGGKGPRNIFFEDVKAIHVSEIFSQKSGAQDAPLYQFSLIEAGAKNPFTIQCHSTEDLEHLVSTMEYFIRHSRLGHDTPLTGMPYPTQGVRLSNDCVVKKLWANSPMDKAKVQLGDHFWSVGKVTSEAQDRKDLEAGLSTLPVTLFAASPSEWEKAAIGRNLQSNTIRPRLRKVSLQP